jgi:hypothetical protein
MSFHFCTVLLELRNCFLRRLRGQDATAHFTPQPPSPPHSPIAPPPPPSLPQARHVNFQHSTVHTITPSPGSPQPTTSQAQLFKSQSFGRGVTAATPVTVQAGGTPAAPARHQTAGIIIPVAGQPSGPQARHGTALTTTPVQVIQPVPKAYRK